MHGCQKQRCLRNDPSKALILHKERCRRHLELPLPTLKAAGLWQVLVGVAERIGVPPKVDSQLKARLWEAAVVATVFRASAMCWSQAEPVVVLGLFRCQALATTVAVAEQAARLHSEVYLADLGPYLGVASLRAAGQVTKVVHRLMALLAADLHPGVAPDWEEPEPRALGTAAHSSESVRWSAVPAAKMSWHLARLGNLLPARHHFAWESRLPRSWGLGDGRESAVRQKPVGNVVGKPSCLALWDERWAIVDIANLRVTAHVDSPAESIGTQAPAEHNLSGAGLAAAEPVGRFAVPTGPMRHSSGRSPTDW